MEVKFYVNFYNEGGGLLSGEGFETIEDARAYIKDHILRILEPGDTVKIEEA